MKHYMLHTAGLTLTPGDRAVADRKRTEVLAAGKGRWTGSLPDQVGGVPARYQDRERITARYGSVAVMRIEGALACGEDDTICWLMGGVPSRWIEEDARALAADTTIETVVMLLASPGGAVAGFSGVSEALTALGKAKRLIAVVADAAYSMACCIAGHASEIYITPSGGMGNIGILAGPFVDETKALEKAGVEVYWACSPDGKAWGHTGAQVTDELKASLSRQARVWYETFVKVFEVRGLALENIDAMNAMFYAAGDAVTAGLADQVLTLDQVLTSLVAGLEIPSGNAGDDVGPSDDPEDPELITQGSASGMSPAAAPRTLEPPMNLTPAHWAGLTADAVKKNRADLLPAILALAGGAAVSTAEPPGIAKLKTEFAGESDFILEAAEKGWTIEQARGEFNAVLRKRLDETNAKLAEAQGKITELSKTPPTPQADAATEKAKATVAGVTVVEGKALGGDAPADPAACPHKTAKDAIKAVKGELRVSDAKAATEAQKRWPQLFR